MTTAAEAGQGGEAGRRDEVLAISVSGSCLSLFFFILETASYSFLGRGRLWKILRLLLQVFVLAVSSTFIA